MLLVLWFGFVWVNRLPAPIVEEQQKPTPVPEQSEAPKAKAKHSPKVTGHRLPAPIVEQPEATPTVAPTPASKPKPKPKPRAESVSKKTAISPFAGTWFGSYVGQYHCSDGREGVKTSGKTDYIHISSDGKMSGGHLTFLSGDGRTLTWRPQGSAHTEHGASHATITCTMYLNGPTSATGIQEEVYTDGPLSGCIYKWTGTYTRQ